MVSSPTAGDDSHATRNEIEHGIASLGGPIQKTIEWYLKTKGVFGESDKVDLQLFYENLKELLGPGADMIMEELYEKGQSSIKFDGCFASPKIYAFGNGRNDYPPTAAGCTNQPKSTGLPDGFGGLKEN